MSIEKGTLVDCSWTYQEYKEDGGFDAVVVESYDGYYRVQEANGTYHDVAFVRVKDQPAENNTTVIINLLSEIRDLLKK